jgi:broad specificity phosphatase PhoE/predicted kinase
MAPKKQREIQKEGKKEGKKEGQKGGKTERENKAIWVVLVCGLPGSGKTTVRQKMVANGWSYVSQDEMISVDACEKALVKTLKAGQSCVVDRCNVTPSDRRLWMQYATRAVEKGLIKGVELHFEAVWMATPPHICKERAQARTAHETLSPEAASGVIDSFCRGLQPPERSGREPYDAVHFIASQEDAQTVIQRFRVPAGVDRSISVAAPAKALALAAAAVAAAASAPAGGEQQISENGQRAASSMDLPRSAELFILRHGERADRAQDRDGGWPDDPPLTKDGRQAAKQAGAALCGLATVPWAAAVYTSPYFRCLQTANEIAGELGLPVRVEPGLAEFCGDRLFERQPLLRPPEESLGSALIRAEVDLTVAPHRSTPPAWPETHRDANVRVLETARAIAARHPGLAVCLVCHSHSVVELTRHLPSSGGGAAASRSGYCALSHIMCNGALIRCLDQSYLREGRKGNMGAGSGAVEGGQQAAQAGSWADSWDWQAEQSES